MKKYIGYFVLVFILSILCIPTVFADGCMFSDEQIHLNEPYQKAVIVWDKETSTETMVLSAAVKSEDIGNFAWIVPIQSKEKPEVYASNITVFEHLVDYFTEYRGYGKGFGDMTAGMAEGTNQTVTVIESKEIDIYDITILQATDSSNLIDWLNENNYQVPDEAENMFQRYIQKGDYYFIANKIDLKNKYAEEIKEIEEKYETLKTITKNANGEIYHDNNTATLKEKIDLINRYERGAKWYDNTNCYYKQYHQDGEKWHYRIQKDAPDYCKSIGYTNPYSKIGLILWDLQEGMGTPLKFVFKPKEMYFPLEITSLNSGYTNIEVYVISDIPVIDKNELLSFDKTKQINAELKEKLQDNLDIGTKGYVTRLTYYDDVKYLNKDSVFQEDRSKIIEPIIDVIQQIQKVWGTGWVFRMFG